MCGFKLLRPLWNLTPTVKANFADDFENADRRGSKPDSWCQFLDRPEELPIESTSMFLFPGQGAQFVGMGKNLLKVPGVKELYETASSILRTDLLKTCLEGPVDKLRDNIHCQPAVYVTSLAAAKMVQHESPKVIENCVAAAGYSVGEITALVFAGSFTFEEGLHLVRVRAEAMQRCCRKTPGGMLSIKTSPESRLVEAIQSARNHCQFDLKLDLPVTCQIASFLGPEAKVVSGISEAIDYVEKHAEQFRLKSVKRLDVAGPYHTALMEPAMYAMQNTLSKMAKPRTPRIPVVSNYDAEAYGSPHNIIPRLVRQVKGTIYWEQTLHCMYSRPNSYPFPMTVEAGPGRQLGATLRMVNRKAFERYRNVEV
ncbi:hypothetical protein Aperf_G00000034491 [Anoplocephala perfoliata]